MENAMTEDLISRAVAIRDFDACNAYGPEWTPQRVKQLLVRQPPVYAMPEGIDSFDKAAELEKHLREFARTKECEAQCGLSRVLKEAADMLVNQAYIILGVMHSVDKWLDGKELEQDEVNRAVQCDGVPARLHHRPRLYGQPVPEERTGRPLWQCRLPSDGRGCCKGKLPRICRQSGRHHHDNGRPAGHGGGVERSKTWTKRN